MILQVLIGIVFIPLNAYFSIVMFALSAGSGPSSYNATIYFGVILAIANTVSVCGWGYSIYNRKATSWLWVASFIPLFFGVSLAIAIPALLFQSIKMGTLGSFLKTYGAALFGIK